jgi:hypothetical protein
VSSASASAIEWGAVAVVWCWWWVWWVVAARHVPVTGAAGGEGPH